VNVSFEDINFIINCRNEFNEILQLPLPQLFISFYPLAFIIERNAAAGRNVFLMM
jgi:hypothetical protein